MFTFGLNADLHLVKRIIAEFDSLHEATQNLFFENKRFNFMIRKINEFIEEENENDNDNENEMIEEEN